MSRHVNPIFVSLAAKILLEPSFSIPFIDFWVIFLIILRLYVSQIQVLIDGIDALYKSLYSLLAHICSIQRMLSIFSFAVLTYLEVG